MDPDSYLSSLRRRTRPISKSRLRYLGKSLYGSRSPNGKLNSETLLEAERVLTSATENESAAVRDTVALLRSRVCSVSNEYEDNVSSDEEIPLPNSLAIRPSHLRTALTQAEVSDDTHVQVRAAVRGIAQGVELDRDELSRITQAVHSLGTAFRRSSNEAPIRATVAAFYSDPPLAASTIRMAELRTSALLRLHNGHKQEDVPCSVTAVCRRAGLSLSSDALQALTRTYGKSVDLAEDPAQLADAVTWLGGEVSRRRLVAALRDEQTDVLLGRMVESSRRLAVQLITALRSSRRVLAASPETLREMLRVSHSKLHTICIALFGMFPTIFNRLNGFLRHPYAAAAAVYAAFNNTENASKAPLLAYINLRYEAASEEELLRLFVLLHANVQRVLEWEWKVVYSLLHELEIKRNREVAIQLSSKIVEYFDNQVDRLVYATPKQLQSFVPYLSEVDAELILASMIRVYRVTKNEMKLLC